jgi:hypothetical protein
MACTGVYPNEIKIETVIKPPPMPNKPDKIPDRNPPLAKISKLPVIIDRKPLVNCTKNN